jgi:ribosomal protein L12E/L44/L45/RPP1/RPP2
VKPQINEETIYKVLKNLGVKVDNEQSFELKQYIQDLSKGHMRSINLVQFLTDVGLKP